MSDGVSPDVPAGSAGTTGSAGSAGEAGPAGRDPSGAVRGVGAAALGLEAVVLLLAVLPLARLNVRHAGLAIGAVLVLAVASLVLAGLARHRWAWYAAIVVQVLLAACGVFHLALLALGILFGAVWAYVLSVRRSLLGGI